MSGHSKWAKIHRQKGVADAKKGAIFTRLGNAITIATREGGGDLDTNFKLRLAVDQAKASNMPKDNIARAIKRGTGELEDGRLEEVVYEGFGPAQSAFMVECVTDNRNRTGASIKHIFSKQGGSLGGPNSVGWQFEKKGSIGLEDMPDDVELELIEAGATDIQKDDDVYVVYSEVVNLQKVKNVLEEKRKKMRFVEIGYFAKEKKMVSDADKVKIQKFTEALEGDEDVKDYYTNVEM